MSINTEIISGHNVIIDPDGICDLINITGSGSGDLGTLCQSIYINKWAKYKPVSVPNLLDTKKQLENTPVQIGSSNVYYRPWKSTATWYKGNGTCGLQVPLAPRFWNIGTRDDEKLESIRLAEASSLEEWYNNGWQYLFGPGGTIASPFRLIDFHCYDHNAVPFVKNLISPENNTYYAGEDSEDLEWTMVLPDVNSHEGDLSLSLSDLSLLPNTSLANCHLGLIFVNVGSKFPDYSNFKYRKFVAINPIQIQYPEGKSIKLTGKQTSVLINDNNIVSEQDYLVYPIITTGLAGADATSIVLFGSTDFGSMIVIPNAKVFSLSLIPNELEGFIEGVLDYYSTSDNYHVYEDTYISIVNRSTKNAAINSATDIHLEMQLWKQAGASFQLESTILSGYTFPNITFPVTIPAGSSKVINVRWVIDDVNFEPYAIYNLRETGTINYKKQEVSIDSVTTLLSYPTYTPNNVINQTNFQSHITVKNIQASFFTVNVWAENISGNALDFSWNSVVYDVISYAIRSSGTDYEHPVISSNNSIANTTENIQVQGITSIKTVDINTPNGTGIIGYLSNVTIHSSVGNNIKSSNVSTNYSAN